MKDASKYPVSFPYWATDSPYSPANPHKGNDRACPVGTPIVIGTVIIGLTGNTGLSTGPHLHIQAGTDFEVQKTVNPTPYEFKAGVVVGIRDTDTAEWGKYVKIKVGDKYVVYAHLSKVNVTVGQVLKRTIKELQQERIDKLSSKVKAKDKLIASLKRALELARNALNKFRGK